MRTLEINLNNNASNFYLRDNENEADYSSMRSKLRSIFEDQFRDLDEIWSKSIGDLYFSELSFYQNSGTNSNQARYLGGSEGNPLVVIGAGNTNSVEEQEAFVKEIEIEGIKYKQRRYDEIGEEIANRNNITAIYLKDDDGHILATHMFSKYFGVNEIDIAIDFFTLDKQGVVPIVKQAEHLKRIIVRLMAESEKILQAKFIFSKDNKDLIDNINKTYTVTAEANLMNIKNKIEHFEEKIRRITNDLKISFDNLKLEKKAYILESRIIDNPSEKIISELEKINNHNMVERVLVKNNNGNLKYSVYTKPIIMHTIYNGCRLLGPVTIEFNPYDTDVRIFADEKRPGYWSSRDNHPHVDSNGKPCLGNVASTIAQLHSDNEIYATFLMMLDYTQSINEEDSAGSRYKSWQKCDEEGNFLEDHDDDEYDDERAICYDCEGNFDDDELYPVYTSVVDFRNDNHLYVCLDCRDAGYTEINFEGQHIYMADYEMEGNRILTQVDSRIQYGADEAVYVCETVADAEDGTGHLEYAPYVEEHYTFIPLEAGNYYIRTSRLPMVEHVEETFEQIHSPEIDETGNTRTERELYFDRILADDANHNITLEARVVLNELKYRDPSVQEIDMLAQNGIYLNNIIPPIEPTLQPITERTIEVYESFDAFERGAKTILTNSGFINNYTYYNDLDAYIKIGATDVPEGLV